MRLLQLKPRNGPSSAFLTNIFFVPKGSKRFYSYLLSQQLVLYHAAAVKRSPRTHLKCRSYFTFGPLTMTMTKLFGNIGHRP